MQNKSTTEEIKKRFDKDVDRFSNLESGQTSTIDATISLEIITESAKRINPQAKELLDIGCGAGNYTLKMLEKLPNLNCTLVDLSSPMLNKAQERISIQKHSQITAIQGDIRTAELKENYFDIILAGAVLHHLRNDDDWFHTFTKVFKLLKKGGCLIISDLVSQETEALTSFFQEKYTEYLTNLGGIEYAQKVQAYIEKEDSPRSVTYQLELMKKVGFCHVEILHKNGCFAAYGGIK